MFPPVIFHQRIISPHMAGLAGAVADRGHDVTYLANIPLSPERAAMGWAVPDAGKARIHLAQTAADAVAFLHGEAPDSLHLCQGLRANGLVGEIQRSLTGQGRPFWVMMETIDGAGWRGAVRSRLYARGLRRAGNSLAGILAIGEHTRSWLIARGADPQRVYPFCYYLPSPAAPAVSEARALVRFIFAGALIPRKQVNRLLQALSGLRDLPFELVIVGDGPERAALMALSARLGLEPRIRWAGTLPMQAAQAEIAQADCLILPSWHDGWGSVVSEALLLGVPAICSDRCGSAAAVRASGTGGISRWNDPAGLAVLLRQQVGRGPVTQSDRIALRQWAAANLSASAGAERLEAILAGGVSADAPLFTRFRG